DRERGMAGEGALVQRRSEVVRAIGVGRPLADRRDCPGGSGRRAEPRARRTPVRPRPRVRPVLPAPGAGVPGATPLCRAAASRRPGVARSVFEADVAAVWDVVRDVTRVGDWSHECVSATWLGDATAAAPGARFRGRNRAGIFRWGRRCEVISAQPYELVWRTVPTTLYPDSTVWA